MAKRIFFVAAPPEIKKLKIRWAERNRTCFIFHKNIFHKNMKKNKKDMLNIEHFGITYSD